MKNKIGWTDATLNPFFGCTAISDGCKNCYAVRAAAKLSTNPLAPQYKDIAYFDDSQQFTSNTVPRWTSQIWMASDEVCRVMFARLGNKPKIVFVGSMGDLFHPSIPADFIAYIFDLMWECRQHQYVILTKRPERLIPVLYGEDGHFCLIEGSHMSNVYIGVSVENQDTAVQRIAELVKLKDDGCGAWKVGISAEPLLGAITIPHLDKIDWVLSGSETGAKARPAQALWFESLKSQCEWAGIPFYLKQMGKRQHQDRLLDGREYNDTPWRTK